MISRRSFLRVVGGFTSAGLGAACGPTGSTPSAATPTPRPIVTAAPAPTSIVSGPPAVANAAQVRKYAGQQVAVSALTEGSRDFADRDDAKAAQFTADTGVKVQFVRHTFSDVNDVLKLYQGLLEARSSDIDVLHIDVIWTGPLGKYLLDLNPTLAEAARQHYPAIIQNNTVDGRLIGMPVFADVGMLFYRTDLLQKYRIAAPPRTWEELEQQATQIVAGERGGNPSFTGYVFQGASAEALTCNALEWLVSSGAGNFVDNGQVTINNPAAVGILNRIKNWPGTISPRNVTTYVEEDARTAFQTGNAAFMRNWPYAHAMGNAPNSPIRGKFDVAPLPAAPGQKSAATVGGFQVAVSSYSRVAEAATEYIRYDASPEQQTYRAVAASQVPTIPSVAALPEVQQAEPFLATLQDLTRVTRPSAIFGTKYSQASAVIYRGVNQILNGQDAGPILVAVQRQLEQLLA